MAPSFDPQASGFSLPNAQLLGQAAAVAYQDATVCEAWALAHGLDQDFDFFNSSTIAPNTDTQGFVVQNADIVLVAFRGTQPNVPVDWLSDFQAAHETWGHPTGTVHKGFYDALRTVWGMPIGGKEILPARLLNRGNRSVWITGHSLGGALAELCAAQTHFVSHVPVQGVYTFGQPRCGDNAFAGLIHAAFGTRICRFINDRDIVPRVPFFGMGYRHYGCEVFFDHEHKQVDCAGAVENLAAALKLGFQAVDFNPVAEAAKMFAEAAMLSALHGDVWQNLEQLMRDREKLAKEAARAVLATGTENIQDHNMVTQYLARLGSTLTLAQPA